MLLLEEKIIFYHVVVLLAAVQLNWQRIFFFSEGGGTSCYVDLCALYAWLHDFPNVEEEAVDLNSPF